MNDLGQPIGIPIPQGFRDRQRQSKRQRQRETQSQRTSYSSPQPFLTTPRAPAFSVSAEQELADAEVERKARRIALIATEQIDEGSLIGYPSLGPEYAAFVETVVFYAARGVLES